MKGTDEAAAVEGAMGAPRVRSFSFRGPPVARVSLLRDYAVLLTFVALTIALALANSAFLTGNNLSNILEQWSAIGIIACAGTLVFVVGGFDLSVAATFAITGVIGVKVANSTGTEAGIVLGCLAGAGIGYLNGALVTWGRVNAFIATLATSIMIEGVALALSDSATVFASRESFGWLGNSELLGLKLSVWLFAVVAIVLAFVLHRTVLGRRFYAAGGNEEAARLSGVNVGRVRRVAFVLSGLCAGLAGILAASRIQSVSGTADIGILFEVIIAIVLGGTSIMGGSGAIWRTVIGVLLLAEIGNGFNLLAVDPVYQRIVYGAVLIAAVAIDAWTRGVIPRRRAAPADAAVGGLEKATSATAAVGATRKESR